MGADPTDLNRTTTAGTADGTRGQSAYDGKREVTHGQPLESLREGNRQEDSQPKPHLRESLSCTEEGRKVDRTLATITLPVFLECESAGVRRSETAAVCRRGGRLGERCR